MHLDMYDVLIKPRVTERTYDFVSKGIYAFDVHPDASKIQIKEAVETIFKVKVTAVNTTKIYAKDRGRGRFRGLTGGGKKAFVHLQPGDSIPLFEAAPEE